MNPYEKMISLERDAREFGFDWPNCDMIIDQIISEAEEIRNDISACETKEKIQEEIGDLLLATLSLCEHFNISLEETYEKTNIKFNKRMTQLKKLSNEAGYKTLHGLPINITMSLWEKAKKIDS